jgi:hypothetical protein
MENERPPAPPRKVFEESERRRSPYQRYQNSERPRSRESPPRSSNPNPLPFSHDGGKQSGSFNENNRYPPRRDFGGGAGRGGGFGQMRDSDKGRDVPRNFLNNNGPNVDRSQPYAPTGSIPFGGGRGRGRDFNGGREGPTGGFGRGFGAGPREDGCGFPRGPREEGRGPPSRGVGLQELLRFPRPPFGDRINEAGAFRGGRGRGGHQARPGDDF